MNGVARSRRADLPSGSRGAEALGGRGRAAGYLRADHVELAVVLQLELDGLLPEGLAQRHHHHCGGGGRQSKPGSEGSGGLRRGRGAPSRGSRSWAAKGSPGQVLGLLNSRSDDDQAALRAHAHALTPTRALPPPKQKARARSRGSLKGA